MKINIKNHKKYRKHLIITVCFILTVFSVLLPGTVKAASLFFSPTAGSYNVWVKLPKEVRQYQFIITDHITYQYFITAWYSVTDANGVIKTVESVGSNHLRITVSP